MSLPLTVIGGYLGSGKTTMVNHLLRHADGLRLAVLVNEFGALPIDEDLIEAQGEDIISIAGGCVCCSYGNDLTLALIDLQKLDPPPDHVILEASGVALPGAIAASVGLLQGYTLDGVIVLTNAETIQDQAVDNYTGDTIQRQLDDADLVVLNKTDLVGEGTLPELTAWLERAAGTAEIALAVHGKVPREIILQSYLGRDYTNDDRTHLANLFRTLSLKVDQPVDAERLAEVLASKTTGLVRSKGFVTDKQGSQKTIQTVGRRWSVTDAPDGVKNGLVVIGPKDRVSGEQLENFVSNAIDLLPL